MPQLPALALAVCFFAAPAAALAQTPAERWILSDMDGVPVATWRAPEGPPLVSVGCDVAQGELVIFRAAPPPLEDGRLTLVTGKGELALSATPDPEGTPGLIARAPADATMVELLSTTATITFRLAADDESGGGLATPVEQPLRDVVEGCGRD